MFLQVNEKVVYGLCYIIQCLRYCIEMTIQNLINQIKPGMKIKFFLN